MQRTSSSRRSEGGEIASPSEAGQVTRWWMRLSGRGRWLALAGLIGALAGAAAGWWGLGQITYRADGVVRLGLAQTSASVADDTNRLRMDQVVERELAELRRLAGPPKTEDQLAVRVRRAQDAETRLDLTATATNPDTAAAAVTDILAMYYAVSKLDGDAAQAEAWNAAMAALGEMRAEAAAARSQLADTRAAMRDNAAGDAANPALPITETDPVWTAAIWTQNEARRAREIVRQRLEELNSLPVPGAEQVAALDPEAASWWGRVRGLNQQLAEAVWPPNPAMAQRLQKRLTLEAQLQVRAQDTRIVPLGEAGIVFRAVRLSETQEQLEQLTQAQAAAEQRVAELEPRLAAWRNLNAEVQGVEARLAMQEVAAAQLDPGSGVRLIEAGPASTEAVVWRDPRPVTAALAAAAGGLVAVLLCGVFFVFDKRVRQSRDGGLVGSAVPVLGAVPTTDESRDASAASSGGEQSMEVASIQSVRAVLESKMRPATEGASSGGDSGGGSGGGGAFAVTGIAAGSGTTSVAVGLAVSMALSGSRVLLIDLAWLQKPAGTGTDDDAARQGLGVDGVIEELGYLDDEDREAIALGDDSDVGFGAILRGVSLRRSVVQTRVAGLSVLSAMGRAEALRAEWAGRVSSRWLSKLMDVARRGGYTATILDAGSATGSVEGMLGCAAADGTVVVVSGGQTQADYDKAVTRLRLVGATILGTVLNRSDAKRLGRKRGSGTALRANVAGGTTGSGIFAAAIEARSGGGQAGAYGGGSGMLTTAPLPRVEDDLLADASPIDPLSAGVDPFSEPPAEAKPTPPRQPPARSANADALPAQPSPEDLIAEAFATEAEALPRDLPSSPDAPDNPPAQPVATAEAQDASDAPEVHVADDVMDQLVDHAIRTAAQRPRPPQPTPPADSSS